MGTFNLRLFAISGFLLVASHGAQAGSDVTMLPPTDPTTGSVCDFSGNNNQVLVFNGSPAAGQSALNCNKNFMADPGTGDLNIHGRVTVTNRSAAHSALILNTITNPAIWIAMGANTNILPPPQIGVLNDSFQVQTGPATTGYLTVTRSGKTAFGGGGFDASGEVNNPSVLIVPNYGGGPGQIGIGTSNPQAAVDAAGEVRVGNAGGGCSAANAGAIRYDSSTSPGMFYGCDGTSWSPLSAGGPVFGGTYINFSDVFPQVWYCGAGNPLNGGQCSCPAGYNAYWDSYGADTIPRWYAGYICYK